LGGGEKKGRGGEGGKKTILNPLPLRGIKEEKPKHSIIRLGGGEGKKKTRINRDTSSFPGKEKRRKESKPLPNLKKKGGGLLSLQNDTQSQRRKGGEKERNGKLLLNSEKKKSRVIPTPNPKLATGGRKKKKRKTAQEALWQGGGEKKRTFARWAYGKKKKKKKREKKKKLAPHFAYWEKSGKGRGGAIRYFSNSWGKGKRNAAVMLWIREGKKKEKRKKRNLASRTAHH